MEDKRSQQLPEPPVPVRAHYEIMKFAEEKVMKKLRSIEKDWLLVGSRVSYKLPPEEGERPGEEFKVECGYLQALDFAEVIEVDNDEWQRIVEEGRHKNPLPIEFVDELYTEVKKNLEKIAGQELLVGVFGVLLGSAYRCYGSGCYCFPHRRMQYCYYDPYTEQCIRYCTSIEC